MKRDFILLVPNVDMMFAITNLNRFLYFCNLLQEGATDGTTPLPLEDVKGKSCINKDSLLFLLQNTKESERLNRKERMILPSIAVDNQQYAIPWDDFLTKMRAIPNVSVVGIPRTYWKIV